MAIRTVDEYKKSLRDGRRVYIMGEKVEDVTAHPALCPTCDTVGGGDEPCHPKILLCGISMELPIRLRVNQSAVSI